MSNSASKTTPVYCGLQCITSINRFYGSWGDSQHYAVTAMSYNDRWTSYDLAEYGLYAGSLN